MTITKTLLLTEIANSQTERDNWMAQADAHAQQRLTCIDNANTCHGAVIAAQKFLALLEAAEKEQAPIPPNAEPAPDAVKALKSKGNMKKSKPEPVPMPDHPEEPPVNVPLPLQDDKPAET